jgi:hypothetical protein
LPSVLTLNNYSGNFSWLNTYMGGAGYLGPITVTNPTPSTNVLLRGDGFRGDGFQATTTWNVASGGNVFGKDNFYYNPSFGWFPTADIGGTPSASFIRAALNQTRTVLPSLNTPTGAGVSDVQITNVWVDYATNALHVKYTPIISTLRGSLQRHCLQ